MNSQGGGRTGNFGILDICGNFRYFLEICGIFFMWIFLVDIWGLVAILVNCEHFGIIASQTFQPSQYSPLETIEQFMLKRINHERCGDDIVMIW